MPKQQEKQRQIQEEANKMLTLNIKEKEKELEERLELEIELSEEILVLKEKDEILQKILSRERRLSGIQRDIAEQGFKKIRDLEGELYKTKVLEVSKNDQLRLKRKVLKI